MLTLHNTAQLMKILSAGNYYYYCIILRLTGNNWYFMKWTHWILYVASFAHFLACKHRNVLWVTDRLCCTAVISKNTVTDKIVNSELADLMRSPWHVLYCPWAKMLYLCPIWLKYNFQDHSICGSTDHLEVRTQYWHLHGLYLVNTTNDCLRYLLKCDLWSLCVVAYTSAFNF